MASGGAAAAAAIIKATKASGVIVRIEPAEFLKVLNRVPEPMVISAPGGVFTKNYQYLTSYKGLAFFTKSGDPLELPAGTELIKATSIWMP